MSPRTRLAFAAAVLIATAAPAAVIAAPAPAAWTVDKGASRLTFKSTFGGQDFTGTFRRWDAQIRFDPKQLAASKATVTIDMGSAATGDSQRDEALPTSDWFDTGKFPRATFVTTSFRSLGANRYQAAGNLTIRGVTKPIVLPFTLAITGDQARMNASIAINRTAFGVGQGQFASAETVPLNVAVDIAITARRAK